MNSVKSLVGVALLLTLCLVVPASAGQVYGRIGIASPQQDIRITREVARDALSLSAGAQWSLFKHLQIGSEYSFFAFSDTHHRMPHSFSTAGGELHILGGYLKFSMSPNEAVNVYYAGGAGPYAFRQMKPREARMAYWGGVGFRVRAGEGWFFTPELRFVYLDLDAGRYGENRLVLLNPGISIGKKF